MLKAVAPLDPDADAALDIVDEASSVLDGDRLPDRIHHRHAELVIGLEEALGEREVRSAR